MPYPDDWNQALFEQRMHFPEPCAECDGTGKDVFGKMVADEDASDDEFPNGRMIPAECDRCHGTGEEPKHEREYEYD